MLDYFKARIQHYDVEFNRISYSAFDNWYHLTVKINEAEVSYRMGLNAKGAWEIKTPRLSPIILGLETRCREEILKNEV